MCYCDSGKEEITYDTRGTHSGSPESFGTYIRKVWRQAWRQKNTLSALERGVNGLTDQMAKAICREYNVSYDYLIYGEGDPFDDLPQTVLDLSLIHI